MYWWKSLGEKYMGEKSDGNILVKSLWVKSLKSL